MSIQRQKRKQIELGYDSFLDIVANLVGILIILVVVLGAQSSSQIAELQKESESKSATQATANQINQLSIQQQRSLAAQADSNRFEALITKQRKLNKIRERDRDLLLDALSQAEEIWEESQANLDSKKIKSAKRATALVEEQSRILDLQNEISRLKNRSEQTSEIQHLPTPMAKTVFGDEVHFRLKGDRLSVVPIEQLIADIKLDFKRASQGSRDGRQESAVGPIRGYVARYEIEKERGTISNGGQIQTATRIQLVNLSVEPLSEPYGDPIAGVISDGQLLDIELAGRDPGSTTITVWVYPDSFNSFRSLKEELYERGFATAARPLPFGHVISGGPDGSRSQAQ